jgi:hypothetical protein
MKKLIDIDNALFDKIRKEATKNQRTVVGQIRWMLTQYFKK